MSSTGCHFTRIVSAAATQRQIVLYYDVVTHQQPVCQEAWYQGKNMLLTVRTVMLEEHVDLVAGDFTGAARCHLAPHRCGDQVQCQVNGPMYVALSSHRTPEMSGKYASSVPSPSPTARWVFRKKIRAATTKCGCISLTLTREAIVRRSTNTNGKYT